MSTRRQFVITGVCLALAPQLVWAAAGEGERELVLTNTHTNETVKAVYKNSAGFIEEECLKLDRVLRDHRSGEQFTMDRALYDQLADLARDADCHAHFEIISGFRSPASNEMLRKKGGGGVAEKSLHMEGRAIDVRLKGCPCERLRDLALAAKRGGVGFYPSSDFVHIDTGRVRTWAGR